MWPTLLYCWFIVSILYAHCKQNETWWMHQLHLSRHIDPPMQVHTMKQIHNETTIGAKRSCDGEKCEWVQNIGSNVENRETENWPPMLFALFPRQCITALMSAIVRLDNKEIIIMKNCEYRDLFYCIKIYCEFNAMQSISNGTQITFDLLRWANLCDFVFHDKWLSSYPGNHTVYPFSLIHKRSIIRWLSFNKFRSLAIKYWQLYGEVKKKYKKYFFQPRKKNKLLCVMHTPSVIIHWNSGLCAIFFRAHCNLWLDLCSVE